MNPLKQIVFTLLVIGLLLGKTYAQEAVTASEEIPDAEMGDAIFDDKALMEGYLERYANESSDILMAMIADDSLGSYKCAAAARVFAIQYANDTVGVQKANAIRILIRRLRLSDSPFVHVEIMNALIVLDRYAYFESMVPALIQKLDHYNTVVRDNAFDNLQNLVKDSNRTREARIVFNTLRKTLFLSRRRLENVTTVEPPLKQKLNLLRWSVKILGTQELKRLPTEVIRLL